MNRLSPALIGAMLGLSSETMRGDPVKASRRRRLPKGRGSMRKATRYSWNGTENERRARQIERGALKAENGVAR